MKNVDFDFERCLVEAHARLEAGATTEDVLEFLRQSGASILQSIRLLCHAKNIDLGESKRLVHFSKTWEDFREGSEQLQNEAESATLELARGGPFRGPDKTD